MDEICYIPFRVRLRSSTPLASNSLLHIPKKFSSGKSSPLKLLLEFPLLPLLLQLLILLLLLVTPPAPKFLSTGITAAIFHTSFRALAFNVAAPRKAAIQFHNTKRNEDNKKIFQFPSKFAQFLFQQNVLQHVIHTSFSSSVPVAAPAVRVVISPADLTFTAELITDARCSRSAPKASATSTHCAATSVAADATAMSVFAICSSFPAPDEAAVAAAIAATAAATPATDTAAWSWALCALVSSFFFSFLSLSHLPTVLPVAAGVVFLKLRVRLLATLLERVYCREDIGIKKQQRKHKTLMWRKWHVMCAV